MLWLDVARYMRERVSNGAAYPDALVTDLPRGFGRHETVGEGVVKRANGVLIRLQGIHVPEAVRSNDLAMLSRLRSFLAPVRPGGRLCSVSCGSGAVNHPSDFGFRIDNE